MRLIKLLVGLVAAGILLPAIFFGYHVTRPIKLPAPPVTFSLEEGASLKSAARKMHEAGILSHEWPIVLLGRLTGDSTRIKAGHYRLESAEISAIELLNIVSRGLMKRGEVSIIEGWTFRQFRDALDRNPDVRHDTRNLSDADILQRLEISEKHPEGLFFPDTYYFSSGTSDLVLLKQAYLTMQARLMENWATRAAGLPLKSPREALILASIVEKETGRPDDRSTIAAVFLNRLRRGMLLQTDPSVIYGLGARFDGNLRKRDLMMDGPYNTYRRAGLPPTPIALPGLDAIKATLHPAQSNALYFVARGDGSSEFSATLIQHNRAVNRYQK